MSRRELGLSADNSFKPKPSRLGLIQVLADIGEVHDLPHVARGHVTLKG